ncbi:hypothetical protein [Hymenobacter humi]
MQAVQLFYRIYLQGSTPPASFTSLTLNFESAGPSGRDKKWVNTTSNPNLLAATSGPGVYVLELFFQAAYNTGSGGATAFIFDNNGGANYRTTFTVAGSVPSQWTGAVSDDWFNPLNWSTGVIPNSTTDVTITFFSTGGFPYPTIRSNVQPAQVRTLRILGNNGALGARNFLTGGELQVYGDFLDPNGGFGQSGGVFTLAGGTQVFDGAAFTNLRIQGGGTKILNNRMDVLAGLSFVGLGGVISTRTDNPILYSVDLGINAAVSGESETSFVLGILRAQRFVNSGQMESFGNIGVDLTTNGPAPRITLATRLTGYVYNGVPPSKSVKRSFTFTPENNNVQSFDLGFHYLDSEVNGILEEDLVLFRSLTGGIPFEPLFRSTLDDIRNIVVRDGITGTLAATFTLGDRKVPLPVTLTSFTAAAQGSDALVNWATAQEINSKGFEVQASSDGKAFQKIGFVASATPNSSAPRAYQYRDEGAKKYGIRYYRLRQARPRQQGELLRSQNGELRQHGGGHRARLSQSVHVGNQPDPGDHCSWPRHRDHVRQPGPPGAHLDAAAGPRQFQRSASGAGRAAPRHLRGAGAPYRRANAAPETGERIAFLSLFEKRPCAVRRAFFILIANSRASTSRRREHKRPAFHMGRPAVC